MNFNLCCTMCTLCHLAHGSHKYIIQMNPSPITYSNWQCKRFEYEKSSIDAIDRDAGKKVGKGADRSKRAPTTLGQQIYPRNGGYPRQFLGNIMGYASHSHMNDCLFQSNIACF